MPKEYSAVVTNVIEWAEGLKSIYLKFGGERMPFQAGQYVMLSTEINGKKENRAYSIASTPLDEELEIVYRVVGPFTNYLSGLKIGDKIEIVGPFGHFTLEQARQRNLVYIATGTGISPLLGMIMGIHKSKSCTHFDSLVVLYGTRYENMLVHRKELEEHERNCKNFKFFPVLSREEKWSGKKGHVQAHVAEFVKENTDYFICGLPEMTDEIEKILLEKGVKKENIHLERY